MFGKDIKQGYPVYKPAQLVLDILKILDSVDMKKFIEKFDKVKGGIDFFYIFWIIFFDEHMKKEKITQDIFLENIDRIQAISIIHIIHSKGFR